MSEKLKGVTTIELTDVNTGKTKVVKKENMVTNATSKLVNNRGKFQVPLLSRDFFSYAGSFSNKRIVEYAFGGLMAFDTPLNDDPDDYSIPSNANCICYGTDISNSGSNNMLGSYNTHESGIQEDGSMRFVWDFQTNQANGTLSSVCLVPLTTAYMGWNNKYDEFDNSLRNHVFSDSNVNSLILRFDNNYYDSTILNSNGTIGGELFVFHDNKYMYGLKRGNMNTIKNASGSQVIDQSTHVFYTHKLKIVKRRFNYSQIDIMGASSGVPEVEDVCEIDIPSEMFANINYADRTRYMLEFDNGFIYFALGTEYNDKKLLPNEKLKILKINVSTWESSIIELTNTTNGNFHHSSFTYYNNNTSTSIISIINNKILLPIRDTADGQTYLYLIDLADNTNVTPITTYDGNRVKYSGGKGLKYKDYLVVQSSLGGEHMIVNFSTATAFPLYTGNQNQNGLRPGGSGLGDNMFVRPLDKKYEDDVNVFFTRDPNATYNIDKSTLLYSMSMFNLMTKNTLSSAITKTSAQTMKITYTISRANE